MQEQFKSHMSPYGFAIRLSDVDTHVSHGDFLCGIKQPTMGVKLPLNKLAFVLNTQSGPLFNHSYVHI